jgi:hypothetical protein
MLQRYLDMPMGRNGCNCSNKMDHQKLSRASDCLLSDEGVKCAFDGNDCAQAWIHLRLIPF